MYYGNALPNHPDTIAEDYRRKYFEAFDLIVSFIKERDFLMYATCKELLVKAASIEDYSREHYTITDFYGHNFLRDVLDTQLNILSHVLMQKVITFYDVLENFRKLSQNAKLLIREVIKLIMLVIVMPTYIHYFIYLTMQVIELAAFADVDLLTTTKINLINKG